MRKGQALQGLGRHREATSTFEAGLQVDPFHFDLRVGLEASQRGVIADLLSGTCRHSYDTLTVVAALRHLSGLLINFWRGRAIDTG